jgi:N-hydroxyarylamine O-acetyltransferase
MSLDSLRLPADLAGRVLEHLGFQHPPPLDLVGLSELYRAWCMRVPFDNTRKMIALRTKADGPLPGAHEEDFLERWLADGTGGTCWPSSNALYAVLRSAGFDARRVIASMRDVGVLNHASVKVFIEGRDWLVDSSMLLNAPLPLGPGVFVGDDPVWPAEVEASNGSHVVWWHAPPVVEYLPCRLLMDPAPFHEYLDGYERSRERSPFNHRLYARRNRPGELVILVGRTRYVRRSAGVTARDLDAGELKQSLREEIGLSAEVIDRWIGCGALAASFEPPPTASPPPVEPGLPPSRR